MDSQSQSRGAPTTFTISPDPSLTEYNVSIPAYLAAHPSIQRLGASIIVFHGPRMLLIQRAPHDFMPLKCVPYQPSYIPTCLSPFASSPRLA